MKTAEKRVLIKGAGEHASGTAHRLFRSGLHVVMTEVECSRAVRRTVSFCTAVFDGQCQVEGVRAERYQLDNAEDLGAVKGDHIPVVVDPECRLREIWKPQVIIDGRILKENRGNSISDAPLVIGFGPGLVAGRDVHFVVETRRGHDLGRIISAGCAAPDTGVPGEIGGYTSERVLRAPTNGIIMSRRTIGDVVSGGDVVAVVGNAEVNTAIGGVLRGLVLPGSTVEVDQKIGDIDPRGERNFCYSISDKARAISGSVLEIVASFYARRQG